MDAFYASVELRDRRDLAGQPVVVGGLSARSVVLSATYEARAFGVRSAMPVSRARRLCPQAVFIPPRHGLYGEVSKEVMAIFRAITPDVEPLSLDEAFLDVAGAQRRLGAPARIAQLIRAQVRDQQGITCSVGVAPIKFVAKIASARCKPDGLLVVPAAGLLEFLHPLPASALWGVGERAEEVLTRLGLRTVGDIAHVPLATLQRELGGAVGEHLWSLAWGRDERRVVPRREEKSVGAEETFSTDVDDPVVIRRELLRLSGRTARALRAAGCVARTISVKLRLASFKTITRSKTLGRAYRRGQGDLRHRGARCTRGPGWIPARGCGWSGSARRACGPSGRPRGSWRSTTARPAGGRRSGRSTRSPSGSAATRCGRPGWSPRNPPAPMAPPARPAAPAVRTGAVGWERSPLPRAVQSLVFWEMNQVRK